MERREILRLLGASLSLSALESLSPAEILAFGREVHARLEPGEDDRRYIFSALDPHQNRTVTAVAELILPETDTPGAKAARVNEFIDLILAEWFSPEERRRFLEGLAELDGKSRELSGKSVVDSAPEQQMELLKAQEAEAIAARAALDQNEIEEGASSRSRANRHFFDVIKWLTLFGYFTSEVGMRDELAYEVFPVSYSGCAPFARG